MDINELETYRLADAVKFHSKLNPRLWHNEQLRPEVKQQLWAIADDFRQFLGIQDLDVKDITISGSNAAYTYTPHSDIDLHLVVNLDNVCDSDVYRELFNAKKYQYNDEHNYKIGGYDVELYVQDAQEPHHSQGIYSLITDDWQRVPNRRHPTVNDISVRSKYEDLGHRIEQALRSNDVESQRRLWDKIKNMRKTGLARSGEFGPENLAFKLLRRHNLLQQLRTAINQARDQELSLGETQATRKKIYGYRNYWFPGYDYYAGLSHNVDQPSEIDEAAQVKIKNKTQPLEHVIEKFAKFCARHLHLHTMPTINLIDNPEFGSHQRTMGRYMDDQRIIEVEVHNRHILDILRTVAHELVHYSQHERGDIPAAAGDTGSPWENEAHAVAGVLMRYFDRAHPEYFQAQVIDDHKVDEGIKDRLAAAAAAACIAGSPGCATTSGITASDAVRGVQDIGRTVQTMKGYGRAGAEEELMQRLKNELRRRQGQVVPEDTTDEDYDPNGPPPGPEFKPTMPKGTVRVDVSDVYDWYKLGQHISNLKGLGKHDFGKGPPSSILSFGDEETEHKYIQDLKRTGLDTTDIDPQAHDTLPGQKTDPTFKVDEALNQPYKLKWYPGDWDEVTAYADLPDGNDLSIMFNLDANEEGEEAWSVEFYRNDSQEVTGEGDEFRVFATVLSAIQTFIKKYKPNRVVFSASKQVAPGQKAQSRARLYDSLVQRYARALGFKAFRADAGNKVHYELNRINKGVAEGVMSDLDQDRQDANWDAIVGYVVNGLKKNQDIGRMELALYKWGGKELVDVDQELEDRGFRDLADLASHIQQHGGRYQPPRDFGLGNLGQGVTEAIGMDQEQGMEWERELMRSWAPKAAAYMAKVVKNSFNRLYPNVPIRVRREDIMIMATTDPETRFSELDPDVFGQRDNPNWETSFVVTPLFYMEDSTRYLELMVDSASSGEYKGVWKLIAREWARYANSQLRSTGAQAVCFSVDQDHSDAWATIAAQAGVKFIVHN